MEKEFYSLAPQINRFKHTVTNVFLILPLLLLLSINQGFAQAREEKLKPYVKDAVFALSKVMMHDVVSPVIASRYYMYCTLGSNAILSFNGKNLIHPSTYIVHLSDSIGKNNLKDPSLAALFSIYESGISILPSGLDIVSEYQMVKQKVRSIGYSDEEILEASILAAQVAKDIIKYATKDGYSKLSAFQKYRPKRKDGYWFPTPPAYMDAVDPYWKTMRTMMIDSSNQFPCAAPIPFDTSSGSKFNALAKEVYYLGKNLSTEQKEIAAFWDCNPFVVATSGHMSLGFKKISPGGHWMNITSIASLAHNISFQKMIQALSIEAITLYDGFIVCWNEKYRTDRARPETIINKFIDLKWQPLLQTPPFPEYTSGHSVISTASAEVLSFLIGDSISFVDDSEVIFELAPRKFQSFRQAANEASISRLYGGIHYRDGIENGQEQGKKVGNYIIKKLVNAGVN
jgi:PAP2 superfamily